MREREREDGLGSRRVKKERDVIIHLRSRNLRINFARDYNFRHNMDLERLCGSGVGIENCNQCC
jgi:hypothetical protein